jgi:hypothetical protein
MKVKGKIKGAIKHAPYITINGRERVFPYSFTPPIVRPTTKYLCRNG